MKLGTVGIAFLAGLLAAVPARAQAPAVTAFVDVSVVPMDTERVLPHQTVVVRGSRIVALGPAGKVPVPATAVRIDGRGKFLIPGLADMHAHFPGGAEFLAMYDKRSPDMTVLGVAESKRMLFLYLASGVTTVRAMYAWPATLKLRAQAAEGSIWSPRIYAAAAPIYKSQIQFYRDQGTSQPSGQQPSVTGVTLDSLVRYVEAAKEAGYDLVKVYALYGVPLDTVAAVARRVGIPIAGHAPPNGGVMAAIQAGFTSTEHGWEWNRSLDSLPKQIAAAARAGLWVCPTLSHNPVSSTGDALIKTLHDGGVRMLLGTDAGVGPVPGASVHSELEALVQRAGLTPYEALVTGTRNPAVYFGTLDSTGTVTVGKRADMVLLSGNPLEDIRHTRRPAGVMVGGRWLPRELIDLVLPLVEDAADSLTILKGMDQYRSLPR